MASIRLEYIFIEKNQGDTPLVDIIEKILDVVVEKRDRDKIRMKGFSDEECIRYQWKKQENAGGYYLIIETEKLRVNKAVISTKNSERNFTD